MEEQLSLYDIGIPEFLIGFWAISKPFWIDWWSNALRFKKKMIITKDLGFNFITWKALEMISSWKATWFLQLQQLYKRGPNSSAIDQADWAPDASPPKRIIKPQVKNKHPVKEIQRFRQETIEIDHQKLNEGVERWKSKRKRENSLPAMN